MIRVITIVIFTFFKNELNKVTKLLTQITYNTQTPYEYNNLILSGPP